MKIQPHEKFHALRYTLMLLLNTGTHFGDSYQIHQIQYNIIRKNADKMFY